MMTRNCGKQIKFHTLTIESLGKVSGMTPKGVLFYAVLPARHWNYPILMLNPFFRGFVNTSKLARSNYIYHAY